MVHLLVLPRSMRNEKLANMSENYKCYMRVRATDMTLFRFFVYDVLYARLDSSSSTSSSAFSDDYAEIIWLGDELIRRFDKLYTIEQTDDTNNVTIKWRLPNFNRPIEIVRMLKKSFVRNIDRFLFRDIQVYGRFVETSDHRYLPRPEYLFESEYEYRNGNNVGVLVADRCCSGIVTGGFLCDR